APPARFPPDRARPTPGADRSGAAGPAPYGAPRPPHRTRSPACWSSPDRSPRGNPVRPSPLIHHDAADRLASVHQVEALVDVVESERVGDQFVNLYFPLHVPVDDARYVGAAAGAAKRGSLPHPAGDQLEGARRN